MSLDFITDFNSSELNLLTSYIFIFSESPILLNLRSIIVFPKHHYTRSVMFHLVLHAYQKLLKYLQKIDLQFPQIDFALYFLPKIFFQNLHKKLDKPANHFYLPNHKLYVQFLSVNTLHMEVLSHNLEVLKSPCLHLILSMLHMQFHLSDKSYL